MNDGRYLFATLAHGNEPYILAASIGSALGDIVIPLIYPEKQEKILRRWVGNNKHVYIDRTSGENLGRILFCGNYQDYVKRVLQEGERVRKELAEYLEDFEAESLAGTRKRFKKPQIELNIGSPITLENTRSFYIFPGLISEYAQNSPIDVQGLKDFTAFSKEAEEKHEIIFIPEVNSFSYTYRWHHKREVPTPPLKRKGYHNAQIRQGIFASLPGSMVLADELIRAAKKADVDVYHLRENPELPGTATETHEIIFNPNILAVLARAGWGTLWLCQIAEKPIITPNWKETDDPEIYHNNRTVEALDWGVIYKEFTEDLILEAATKADNIRETNNRLYEIFGSLDGITFVQEKIKERLS